MFSAVIAFTPDPFLDSKNLLVRAAIREFDADLVLHFDPDEFLYSSDGKNPLEELEKLADNTEDLFRWQSFIYEKDPRQ